MNTVGASPTKDHHMNNSTTNIDNDKWTRDRVTYACERLRGKVESSRWKGISGKNEWSLVLTALDIAQYTGHLDMYLDARTMSFAIGVSPITASRTLYRVCRNRWLIPHPDNAISPRDREKPWVANRYHVNPDYPHMYKYCRFPMKADGGYNLADEDKVTSWDGEEKIPLIQILSDDGRTYTYGDTRTALLVGRTEVGVLLGKTPVWVALKLTDEPRTIKQIANAAQVDPSTAGKVLRHKLGPRGLAVCTEGTAVSTKGLWTAGLPLDEYELDESVNPNKVKARVDQITGDRKEYHGEKDKRAKAWIRRELRKSAREFERV